MEKRGISAIVAVVLTILITIVAVSILWVSVLPVVNENLDTSEEDAKVSIVISKGYTVYDAEKHFAFVQVKRGVDEGVVKKLNFIFIIDGESVIYETSDTPSTNQERTYKFNFSRDGFLGIPTRVAVAPVFDLGGSEKVGAITSEVDMPIKPARVNEQDDIDSEENTVKGSGGGGNNGGEIINYITLTECGEINSSGNYQLVQDISAEGGSNICFNITTSDVSLNLKGHKISGVGYGGFPSPPSYAISARFVNNITLSGGVINWTDGGAIYMKYVTNSSIRDISATNSGTSFASSIVYINNLNSKGIYIENIGGNITNSRFCGASGDDIYDAAGVWQFNPGPFVWGWSNITCDTTVYFPNFNCSIAC